MTDMGYVDVTTNCPVGACAGTNTVRVFGLNGGSYYKMVECSTCGGFYGVKVALTVSGAVTEYDLTPDT